MATVLVIEPDALSLEMLTFLLKQSGHRVYTALDAETAFEVLQTRAIDLLTIEPARQRQEGLKLCQQIRKLDPQVPMIIVSERVDVESVVKGLSSAADDYIRKPFSPQEFLARVQAQLRRAALMRSSATRDDSIVIGDLTLDLQHMSAVVNRQRVPLTPRELSLLRVFMENPDRVLSREQLMKMAWGESFIATPKAVDVYVLRLRQKIGPHLRGNVDIRAVRGFGYRLSAPALQVISRERSGSDADMIDDHLSAS
jgi:DNA-binding response OmpR family regulator